MKRHIISGFTIIVIGIIFLCGPAFAVPGLISYQGKLTDNTGTAIEGTQNMRFRLYNNSVGGTELWSETQNSVPVTGGIYDVWLGLFTALNKGLFAGDVVYLQVEIDNGLSWEVLLPRQRLASTSFAFKAADAETLGGKTLAQIHAEETDPTVLASVKDGVAWSELSGIPAGFADGLDADSGGDITGVTAGTGLTGGGTSGNVTMSVNTSAIQSRVSGACAAGSSIRTVNADGTVACEADDLGITSESDPQVGAITSSYVPRWNGSALVTGAMYDNGAGRIGLGTASPNEQLELTGNLRLPDSTTTSGIIRSGANTLIHTYGLNNFFAGENAGNLTMTGVSNTASGAYALHSNTTGSYNTASGVSALQSNITGIDNTASGYAALYSNTTGSNNTASGYSALRSNITGSFNTASGFSALFSNINGYSNTAIGTSALEYNLTGSNNTASGVYALYRNTEGHHNTASGISALYSNTTGSNNTASGVYALYRNTEGHNNTASGTYVLYSNTTGSWNTANGSGALEVNVSASKNTADGHNSLHFTTGGENTACGFAAGYANASGSQNTLIGTYADTAVNNLTNATAIGYGAVVSDSNRVRIGNTSVTQIGGQVAWSNLSDMRHKRDIGDIGLGLDFITALRPVQFRMREGNERLDFGFIAQDIEALLGEDYNILGIDGDQDRTLSLRYTDFIAPMVKAIQEQQGQIQEQKEMIFAMRSEIEAMKKAEKSEIEAMKAEIRAIKTGR